MINNIFKYNGREFALGGIINGELDNMIITGDGQVDVYEITFDDQSKICLSEKYGLEVQQAGNSNFLSKGVRYVGVNDTVCTVNGSRRVAGTVKRNGIGINIPRILFALNDVIVTRNFSQKWMTVTSQNNEGDYKPVDTEVKNRSRNK